MKCFDCESYKKMDLKSDIEFLQTLLDCAFDHDHYAHTALANIIQATTPQILNHYDWRHTLENMRNSDLLNMDAIAQFLRSALPYPCTLETNVKHDYSIEYILICKPPMHAEYLVMHCVSSEALEHIRSESDHRRFLLAKLLTNMQNSLSKDALFC